MKRLIQIITLFLFLTTFFKINATTIIVQNVNDSGPGSLRTALDNSQSGDIIRFNPNLLNGGNNTITLLSALSVDKPLTIKGLYNQNDTLYISGNNITQIMTGMFWSGVANSEIILDSLALIGGNGPHEGGALTYVDYNGSNSLIVRNCLFKNNTALYGGAIGVFTTNFNDQTIVLENTVIRNCSGGGIAMYSNGNVTLTVTNCDIFGNTAGGGYGGGILTDSGLTSTVIVSGSSIHNNYAGQGGGIYSKALVASLVIVNNSTFNGNSAGQGGAIHSKAISPSSISNVSLTNCTIAGNTAAYTAGGVFSSSDAGSLLTVKNCTIVNNNYVGLYSVSYTSTSSLIIEGSIVALNGGGEAVNISNNVFGNFTSNGYNIFGPISGTGAASDQLNVTAAQLNLGPLQLNGGNTKTMLPGLGSIAIDMGNPADLSAAQNGPLVGSIRDVGAAEVCFATFGDTSALVCDFINWYGTFYNTSGDYTHNLVNAMGCDSVVTLHLTISNSTAGTDIQTTCDSYTWIDGNTYTSSTNTPTFVLPNAVGCDSIVTLNLTILPVVETTEQISHCGPYTWPLNGQTYGFSGQYTDTLQTVNGCDSIVHLTIQINSIPSTNVIDPGNGTLTAVYSGILEWIDCVTNTIVGSGQSFTPAQNGTYALIATDGVTSCSDTSSCIVIDYLGVESMNPVNWSIYPNPTNDQVHITFSGSDAELAVYDVQGKMVLKNRIQNQEIISLQNFERGVYLFDFKNSLGHSVQRVVKQ